MTPNVVIVGDVHGCIDELNALLELAYRPGDRLIFVGDLINKGPDSRAVLERVRELGAEAVIGNHELGYLRYRERSRARTRPNPDFEQVKRQLGKHESKWAKWMAGLPSYIEDDAFLVVHAGLVPGQHPSQSDRRTLARIRTWDGCGDCLDHPDHPAWYELYQGTKLVVFGHWAVRGLVVEDRYVGLDSGCVYGGALSALLLPHRRIVQVPARKVYRSV